MLSRPTLSALLACFALLIVASTSTAGELPQRSEGADEPPPEMTPDRTLEFLDDVEGIINRAEASRRFDPYTVNQYRLKLMRWRLQAIERYTDPEYWRDYREQQREQRREELMEKRGIE